MFGRSKDASTEASTLTTSADDANPATEGKGRPTPTRKEAEAARKARVKPTVGTKEARKKQKELDREQRRVNYEGLRRGEEKYFPPRDRGPVRGFARDYVDSRRTVAEFFLLGLLVVMAGLLTGNARIVAWANIAWLTMLAFVIVELIWIARRVRRQATERFPDAEVKGAGLYAATRATQIRRMRVPPPRVKPGDLI